MQRRRGFSLLELIVVLAIAAIVASIATQAYTRYTFRAHRTDAHRMLMAIAQAQERWYATHNRYADDLEQLGFGRPAISAHGHYEMALSVDADAAQGFLATAIPLPGQAQDACGSLSIDDAGHTLPDALDAWANTNGKCW